TPATSATSTCVTRMDLPSAGARVASALQPAIPRMTTQMANYMGKRPDKNLIIGLDVGTSKIAALVGEVGPDNSIEVNGIGVQPARGRKKGVVVNIESTVKSIQRAIEYAERMAGCEIRSVFAGIAD